MKINHYIIFLLIFASYANAQKGITTLEKSSILIGQQTLLTYHVTLKENFKAKPKPFKLFIPANKKNQKGIIEVTELEIITPFSDTIINVKGKKEWFGTYAITAWDSGIFMIPQAVFSFNDKIIEFPETYLNVKLVAAVKGQDIFDIRESFADIPNEPFSIKQFHSENWWWLDPIIFLIIGLFIYLKLKKKNKVSDHFKQLSLKEKTLSEIEALEKSKLWTVGKLKEHYVELSFILRSYLSTRFEINLLEKTTFESKILLTQKGLHKKTVETIVEILDHADMVKFAKSEPEEITAMRLLVLSKQIVTETSTLEFENV